MFKSSAQEPVVNIFCILTVLIIDPSTRAFKLTTKPLNPGIDIILKVIPYQPSITLTLA